MSNKVNDIMHDIAHRLGETRMEEPFTSAVIKRAMQRVYDQLNQEYKPIVREWSIDFGVTPLSGSLADGYMTLPSDWIVPYSMSPGYEYRPWEVYESTENKVFSINNGRIYFSNVDADTTITVNYYSSGYTLVDKADADVLTGEVNTPEYPLHLQQILIYGTCIDLKSDYPQYKYDLYKYNELRSFLGLYSSHHQEVTPETSGPKAYEPSTTLADPY